jgi:hypothetical protein
MDSSRRTGWRDGARVLRLWTVQVVDARSSVAAIAQNEVRVVSIPEPRGQIVDRNDTALAGVGGALVESSRLPGRRIRIDLVGSRSPRPTGGVRRRPCASLVRRSRDPTLRAQSSRFYRGRVATPTDREQKGEHDKRRTQDRSEIWAAVHDD